MREPCGLVAHMLMVAHGRGELQTEPFAPWRAQGGHMLKVFFGFGGQGSNGLAQFEELGLCVAHQLHENPTLSATAAAKGTHDLCERLLEPLGWAVELGPAAVTLLDDVGDER